MVAGVCAKVSKVILFAVNIVFFLTGAGVLGVGLWLRFDKNVENILKSAETALELDPISSLLVTGAYVLIAFGAIVFVVGFCGCCGAIKESKCLIGIYLAFIVVVLAGELAGGLYAYINFEKVMSSATNVIDEALDKYDVTKNGNTEKPWNFLMIKFDCCGWNRTDNFNKFRIACCYPRADANSYEYGADISKVTVTCDNSQLNNRPTCYKTVEKFLKDNSVIAIAVAGGIAGLEILVFVLALCFCCSLGKD